MGNILRLLSRDDSCCSPQKYDVFLDFENAEPTLEEKDVYEEVEDILVHAEEVLKDLQEYKGASKEIREAILKPSSDCEEKAWDTVLPLVMKLKIFYYFSRKLDVVIPKILLKICSKTKCPTEQLEEHEALVKQFAKVLEFALKFDEYKMMNPAIQNDLSYYRRTIQRQKISQDAIFEDNDDIGNELANRMSLFFAQATPMLQALSDATSTFVKENNSIPVENTTDTFSTMAKVCQKMLEQPDLVARFHRQETELFILRVMVAAVILYDHVHPTGAFTRSSNLDLKGCVKLLREQPKCQSEGLLNALRYTTKHLNEDTTPKNIKALLYDEP